MGNWRLFLIGQLDARADVCAEVCLAANQQDPCAGAEVLDLCFPLPETGEGYRSADIDKLKIATSEPQ